MRYRRKIDGEMVAIRYQDSHQEIPAILRPCAVVELPARRKPGRPRRNDVRSMLAGLIDIYEMCREAAARASVEEFPPLEFIRDSIGRKLARELRSFGHGVIRNGLVYGYLAFPDGTELTRRIEPKSSTDVP